MTGQVTAMPTEPARLRVAGRLPQVAPSRGPNAALWASFVAMVAAPLIAAAAYLWVIAADQYASTVAFSVQKEEVSSAVELIGGVADFGSSGANDADILYAYLTSQDLVEALNRRLDLRSIYARPDDPVFGFGPEKPVEDLTRYWRRMTRLVYDPGTGLIELRALAFDPGAAQAITLAVLDEAGRLIDDLSTVAREDATAHARAEVARAEARLKAARYEVTAFRAENRIVDPSADLAGQMGLLNTLEQELAAALIEADLLRQTTRAGDTRLAQGERRIAVIRSRIGQERAALGVGGPGGAGGRGDYATLMAEYERLSLDREFAEVAYTAAMTAFDAAQAEARRKSRHLAAHIRPTLAQSSEYPRRAVLFGALGFFLVAGWCVGALVWCSIRDRR